jgi:hypothetical protein
MSALVAVGIALVAMPAWSQGAMIPGGGAMTPQPRVAPAPQAPVVAPALSGDRLVPMTNSVRTTGTPTGPEKPMPRYSNNPIPGIDVVVKKQPAGGGVIPTSKADGTGQTTFRQL